MPSKEEPEQPTNKQETMYFLKKGMVLLQ